MRRRWTQPRSLGASTWAFRARAGLLGGTSTSALLGRYSVILWGGYSVLWLGKYSVTWLGGYSVILLLTRNSAATGSMTARQSRWTLDEDVHLSVCNKAHHLGELWHLAVPCVLGCQLDGGCHCQCTQL